ncbi:hypothetical protein ACS0TY_014437 [Phlomoides rotata]
MMKVTYLLLFFVSAASLVVAPWLSEAATETLAISCGKVRSTLALCYMYVMNEGAVPENCCTRVKSLNNEATTVLMVPNDPPKSAGVGITGWVVGGWVGGWAGGR